MQEIGEQTLTNQNLKSENLIGTHAAASSTQYSNKRSTNMTHVANIINKNGG